MTYQVIFVIQINYFKKITVFDPPIIQVISFLENDIMRYIKLTLISRQEVLYIKVISYKIIPYFFSNLLLISLLCQEQG